MLSIQNTPQKNYFQYIQNMLIFLSFTTEVLIARLAQLI